MTAFRSRHRRAGTPGGGERALDRNGVAPHHPLPTLPSAGAVLLLVKQTLKIRRFLGTGENAARIQIAVALIAFRLLR